MGILRADESRLVAALVLAIVILTLGTSKGMSEERINPLRFGESQKSWQMTLNFSRYVDRLTVHTKNARGLWEKAETVDGTSYRLRSSFELNKRIGFRGSISYRSDSIRSKAINLWSGTKTIDERTSNQFGGASFRIKFNIWENSELKTHLFLPVLGGPAAAGLVWSNDPIMVFPRLSIDGSGFDLNTGISFVANSKVAITGRMALNKEENGSAVGLGGGLVYRNGEYDGVKITAFLRRGDSTRVSLEVGLSYGQAK